MAGGRGLLAAALLVLGASVPASWSWSMTASFAPRAGPSPRTALHALQPMYRRAPGCRSAVVGGRRESGAVALQMAGSGASLRVQQMQARLKGLKVQCVSCCLPTPAPVALMRFGEPTTHTHTHTNTHTHTHTLIHCSAHPFTGCGSALQVAELRKLLAQFGEKADKLKKAEIVDRIIVLTEQKGSPLEKPAHWSQVDPSNRSL